MNPSHIEHIGIAVKNLNDSISFYENGGKPEPFTIDHSNINLEFVLEHQNQ